MGAIAGPQIVLMMLTAMEHDLQFRVNYKMDTLMLVSQRSIFYGTQKSNLYQQLSQCNTADKDSNAKYNQIMGQIKAIEAQEKRIADTEKQIEMQMKKLENQLKMVTQRKEGAQKILEQNIKGAFNYGMG